jgi:hypothetical protein
MGPIGSDPGEVLATAELLRCDEIYARGVRGG